MTLRRDENGEANRDREKQEQQTTRDADSDTLAMSGENLDLTAQPAPEDRNYRPVLSKAVRIAAAAVLLALTLWPLIRWMLLIMLEAPNVPFTDEWTWTDVLVRSHAGLDWSSVWQPYNGHRLVVGPVIFLLLDHFGGWNVPREELLNVAFAVVALWALFECLRSHLGLRRGLVATAILSPFLCGWATYETILIGFNISWQICFAAFLLAVLAVSAPSPSMKRLAGSAMLATIATFSSGQGLFVWPAVLVILLLGRTHGPRYVLTWCIAGALCYGCYFWGYRSTVTKTFSLHDVTAYAMTFLGSILGWDGHLLTTLQVSGVALVVLFVALAVNAILEGRNRLAAVAFGCATYAVLGAFATAVERDQFGLIQATSARYASISVFLVVAIVMLLANVRTNVARRVAAFVLLAIILQRGEAHDRSAHGVVLVYNEARRRELIGVAAGDPAAAVDADEQPGIYMSRLEALRDLNDGPVRYTTSRP